jgi:LuxR family maltose regulon positive regulatory protein
MSVATGRDTGHGTRFAPARFQPPEPPGSLVSRPALEGLLTAGLGQRLTLVVGSAGAGKSVLLSSWARTRAAGPASWLSCDRDDADPGRFWSGFIAALQRVDTAFGADAETLLATKRVVSPDVIASLANDAALLPARSAVIVDDFHYVAAAVSADMTGLIERWPHQTAQLVVSSRFDPPLRLHRLRMTGEMCELRDRDLYFSQAESAELLANFGVAVGDAELARLHRRSEGWPAAVQMSALSLRDADDPRRRARALDLTSDAVGEYFAAEVLDHQAPEVAQFMLDTSLLEDLTADACAAVTARPDAAELLRRVDTGDLFLVALDEERTTFRYHYLVRELLRAALRARDRAREQDLQLRAAEWFESCGETRRASRHFLRARQADHALVLLRDQVVADFLRDPALPREPDLGTVDASVLAGAPDKLLALAADRLLSGDAPAGEEYLEAFERRRPSIPRHSRLGARLAATRAVRDIVIGKVDRAVDEALAARAVHERTRLTDDWTDSLPIVLLRAYTLLEDFPAAEREAATALAMSTVTKPVKHVTVPGARALAWFDFGQLAQAAEAARAADANAVRLGFDRHFFAVDYLRVLANVALERRDLDTAERRIDRALRISERGWPLYEFLTLLDRARIWAVRGHTEDALASLSVARSVLPGKPPALTTRADELEAYIRLLLDDPSSAAQLATRLSGVRGELMLARVALAVGDHQAAQKHLQPLDDLTPRRGLERHALLAAAAIERGDPMAAGIVAGTLNKARDGGFLNTVVMTAPQLGAYLIEHSSQLGTDPFTEQMIAAAIEARAASPVASRSGRAPAEPLTSAERRILNLLPTSTYLQIAATLRISHNTVKTHLRSVYQKLGAASRAEALERAVDLRLL